jgi:hypothetical protein
MFFQCSYQKDVRDSATVPVVEQIDWQILQAAGGGAYLVGNLRQFTIGTLNVLVQTSLDGVNYVTLDNTTLTAVDTTYYYRYDGPIPRYQRITLTPAGGFNGTLAVNYYGAADVGDIPISTLVL